MGPEPSRVFASASRSPASGPLTLPGMPQNASAPRIMTGRHPLAVGSYGPAAIGWAQSRAGMHKTRIGRLRWWQRVVICRALEHDKRGRLVWETVVQSGPRQTGKSVIERVICGWRQHMGALFGAPQDVLHLAHKLEAAREVWSPAARFMAGQYGPGSVRWTNGEECITLQDGSRWLIQAANEGAGVAFSLSLVLVDEAWRVPRGLVDNGLIPTMAEVEQPQLWLVSTAGTSVSDLMRINRRLAIAALEPTRSASTLIVEWSAPPDESIDISDPGVWRAASPHWDERRATRIRRAFSKIVDLASEYAFRQQWLNQWVPSLSSPMFAPDVVEGAMWDETLPDETPSALGFDVATDRSHACVTRHAGAVIEVVATPTPAALPAKLVELAGRFEPVGIGYDRTGQGNGVADELAGTETARLLVPITRRDLATACGKLFDRLPIGRVGLRRDPLLDEALRGAGKDPYGKTWTFRRDGEPSGVPLLSAAAALWADEHPAEVEVEESQIWV